MEKPAKLRNPLVGLQSVVGCPRQTRGIPQGSPQGSEKSMTGTASVADQLLVHVELHGKWEDGGS